MMECKNVPVYEDVNRLIFEYLELNGLEETLESFNVECRKKALPCPPLKSETTNKVSFTVYDAQSMMKCFDGGDLEGFVKWWEMFLTHIEVTSEDMRKLEVYIRVHFALWPRAHGEVSEVILSRAMMHLKSYFEEHSSTLAGDTSILPLFALPFVTDPRSHALFKELFTESWQSRLRAQLETTVMKYFDLLQKNICTHSKLAELIVKGSQYDQKKLEQAETVVVDNGNILHQERFSKLLENHRKIRKLLHGTRASYAKLLMIASELFNTLEKAAIDSPELIPYQEIVEKCAKIYPELFTPKDAPKESPPDMEYFKSLVGSPSLSAVFEAREESEVSLFFLGINDVSPDNLDYDKVKETLSVEASPSDRLCLLQALRWMITKTDDAARTQAMGAFVTHDLLGLKSPKPDYRQRLFKCLLSTSPTYHKECFARFLNSLSSLREGRNYLGLSLFVVDTLVESLSSFGKGVSESFICQMVVACLQKLSLKKNMRLAMIKARVINWLVVYIKGELAKVEREKQQPLPQPPQPETSEVNNNKEHFNPYLMEYSWALLMNLCLHEEAWDSCAAAGTDILTSAANMLISVPKKDLAPYVISTLYSVLRSPEMFALAKEMRLESTFEPLLKSENGGDIAHHLSHLLGLLYAEGSDRITSSRETNYDDDENPDPEVLEPELELPEAWINSLGEGDLIGDDLLYRKYLLAGKSSVQAVRPTSSNNNNRTPVNNTKEMSAVMIRPVTPSRLPMVASTVATPVAVAPAASKKKVVAKKSALVSSSASSSAGTTKSLKKKPSSQEEPSSGGGAAGGGGGGVSGGGGEDSATGGTAKSPKKKKSVKKKTSSVQVVGRSSELSMSPGTVISIVRGEETIKKT